MLLIVKLLSFKRYNYPFYKCRESGRQMQCAYSQPVSDEVVPLLFSLFLRFWKQMQCIVSQPLPFLVLQNAYLVAKIQIYIGLEQTIILKNIIPQLLFSIILSHHFIYLHVAIYSDINVILTSINYLSGSNSSIAQMACSSTFLM